MLQQSLRVNILSNNRVSIINNTGKYLFVQSDIYRLSITLTYVQVLQNKTSVHKIRSGMLLYATVC